MLLKKLKIILPLSILILFILNINKNSLYTSKEKQIIGTIYSCSYDDKTIIKIKAKENILINYYDYFPCKLGLKIKATGEMKTPSNNTNFNLFNYKNYLLSLKIYYTFDAKKIEIVDNKISFIYNLKNKLYNYINTYKSKSYLNALILGDTKDIQKNIKNSYQINGISHLLAISGAQITLLSSFIYLILNKIFSKNSSLIPFI